MTNKNAVWLRALLVVAVSLTLLCYGAAAQEIVYFDNFSGVGGPLDGTMPDTSLGGATWAAGSTLLDDGSIGASRFTALLPFQPEPNFIYTLSADMDAFGVDNNWLALGFTQVQQSNLEERWLDPPTVGSQPMLWALTRSAGATDFDQSFLGYAVGNHTAGGMSAPTISADRIVMTLDTTGTNWEWSVDFGDDGMDRTETLTSIPNINYVGLSAASNTLEGSLVDNFELTRLEIPINEWNVDGGGGFAVADNWTQGIPAAGSTVLFGDVLTAENAPAVVNINSPASLEEIRFANTESYFLEGSDTLTLTGSAMVAAIQGAHGIGIRIGGNAGLAKEGGGTLTISNGSNSFTGDIVISSGTLEVTHLGAINQASGFVDVAAGASLQFNGDGDGNGASGTLTEEITGAGTIRLATGLTTEVITASTANIVFTGTVSIGGGKLNVADADALGTADGTAATGTLVGGQFEEGALELAGVTVIDERLQIVGRQPGVTAPHLISTGTSRWDGPIAGTTGGNQYNIDSQSGTITLTGDITMPDSSERNINLSGGGNGRIEGKIIDRTIAPDDGAEEANITVIKKGTGTWTIATGTENRDDFHQGRTVIEQGTLAVEQAGGDVGELWSRTIDIKHDASFDVSSFSTYSLQLVEDPDGLLSSGDETGQELSGAGTVIGNIAAFDDSSISPGDSVGTLAVNGNFSYATFGQTVTGAWNYELGDTTVAGDSDRLLVNGTATIHAASASDVIHVNIMPVEGTLSSGDYALVQANNLSVTGSASNSTYSTKIFDAQGNDITADTRQTASVANSGNNVVLNVSGTSANLSWSGTAGDAWDLDTTGNWTGTGGPRFKQLDNVTFGNVTNKNVTIDTHVAPGSVTFDGGSSSTYTVTGSGGMTGYGPVTVNSGTVQLQNAGNTYAGPTTVATSARLEVNSASTGDMVINGTLSIGGVGVATGGAQTFYSDDFSGAGGAPLNGTTPDTSFAGATWVAAATFEDNGDSVAGTAGGSATLAFTPIDGSTYTLETTIQNIAGDTDWFALGFASGQSTANSSNARFITGTPEGLAWALYRGDAFTNANQTYLGDTNYEPNSGLASGLEWIADANIGGGDVALRLTLNTTGGAGNWTVTMEADTGSGFQTIRATEVLLDESISSVGIANSNTADLTGTLDSFSLTGVEPPDSRLAGQTVTVDGDLWMGADAILEFDIAQLGQDFLNVTGTATLDGTIDVTQLGSFTPADGTEYTILSAGGGITDLGVNYSLPAGFSASIVDLTDLILTFGAAQPADFDNDGDVDGNDFLIWQTSFNVDDGGDADGDGDTDRDDLLIWQGNFGTGSGFLSTAVPEPATVFLLIVGIGGLASRRTIRRLGRIGRVT